ncbi:MAG: YggT family protein [Candidatus Omnitrophica bacterium]|nr:YggT family protein [Candidatus Omnitrophota bacterium]
MFIFGNFLSAVALILDRLLQIYSFVVLVAVLISWVNPDPYNPIIRFLRSATEPVFAWVRRRLPFTMVGMMDLSPIVVFFGIWFLRLFLINSLVDIAARIR